MDRKLLKAFASPPSSYRGKPFWAWNGKLDEAELRRQVRIFRHMGLGGFFMHSRVGLDTAYLGDDWFRCVRACIDEAAKTGLEAWLYDEDRWPSGAAGGLVTRNPKYRMRHLKMDRFENPKDFKWARDTLAAFTATLDGHNATNVQPLARGTRPKALDAGRCILAFRIQLQEPSPWYNGYTYLDTLSHEAVRQYIRVTHEAYRKKVGKSFGPLVPGIFTDEPNVGWPPSDDARPWTARLPAVFRKRYGYDLLPRLVELFYDVDGREVSQARWHYQDCVTFLFVDAFSRQIGQWCARNGLLFTGHVLCEETMRLQTGAVGCCMRHYEHMQAPGMDQLTERRREYSTAKQVTSAARQFGWKWRLTEIYGCTGWDFPFEAHKAVGDWQAALGINLRCPHLAWYTMLAEAKRDYPAGIFYQSPWWELYPAVEDYFARVTAVMTRGREVRDLLVIHPVESMWTLRRIGWMKDAQVTQYDRMLDEVTDSLLHNQIDFDYGDEELLSRHAKVNKTAGSPTLKVGKAAYKAVLVPPMKTMRSTTLALVEKFAAAGGTVVFAGDVAAHVDALPSAAVAAMAGRCPKAPPRGKELADAVAPAARRLSITDPSGNTVAPALYLLREDKDAFYLFIVNTSRLPRIGGDDDVLARDRREAFADVRIRGFAECQGAPVELDPKTGTVFAADAARQGDAWKIRTALPRLASRLFILPKKAGEKAPPRPAARRDVRAETLSPSRWDITLSEANNLVLDRPRYHIGKGDWQGPEEILRVDSAVRDALGIAHRGGAMVQPWAQEKPKNPRRIPVTLAYAFQVQARPSGDLFLAIERPERYRVALNGEPVSTEADCGWWVDKSLRRLPVDPALLRPGDNEITLQCDYDCTHSGFEIIYLLGNFGAAVDGTKVAVTAAPTALTLGDWVGQGLAFYSGSVSYRTVIQPQAGPGQRLLVRLGDYRGAAVRVLVDGRPAGIIGWEPCEVDITDFVAGPGPADLAIEVIGHRRNSHGPHHLAQKWPPWTGPGEYVATGDRWFEGYQLVPCGLMSPPQLVVQR